MSDCPVEREQLLQIIEQEEERSVRALTAAVDASMPNHSALFKAIARSKKLWQEDAVRFFRMQLLEALKQDFEDSKQRKPPA